MFKEFEKQLLSTKGECEDSRIKLKKIRNIN